MSVAVPPMPAVGRIALQWWEDYCRTGNNDPGIPARLRRCRSTLATITEPAALDLARRLRAVQTGQETLALDLARVLAHVRVTGAVPPLRAVGWRHFPDAATKSRPDAQPTLSDLRFRQLLRTTKGEPLVTAFVRLIAVLPESASAAGLAHAFWHWGDDVRRQWSADYFAVNVAAPASTSTPLPSIVSASFSSSASL
jgi:CRISPR type I-E-associated protein CasB/Cse2